jgi:hypothetical protein
LGDSTLDQLLPSLGMEKILWVILRYPYPHQHISFFMGLVLFSVAGFILWGLYRLISRKMNKQIKKKFRGVIISVGFLGVVLFFVTITFCLITTTQVNRQMGFSYATPDTPEGELFVIRKVVPGKIMHEAGLQKDDRVLMPGPNDLYGRIIHNQGSEVLIPVSRDGEELMIKVMAPELNIPFAGLCIFLKKRPEKNDESLPAGK